MAYGMISGRNPVDGLGPAGATNRPPSAAVGRGPSLPRGLLHRPLASYYLLLSSATLLAVVGLIMVFSATSVEDYRQTGSSYGNLFQQAAAAVVGLVAFWWCQRLPVRTYQAIGPTVMIVATVGILVMDVLGIVAKVRTDASGAPRPLHLGFVYAQGLWLYLGPLQLQPSELAKIALVLWTARRLVQLGRRATAWRALRGPLLPAATLLGLVGLNDFGSMSCLLAIVIGMLWVAGVRPKVFAGLFLVMATCATVLIALPGKSYRMGRLTTFLDPSHADPTGPGYQFFQGLYAIADGGWFGVGLGSGHLKWGLLPNAQNDFIFAVIADELGLVGCLLILALFALFTYTGLRIARRVDDPYRRLVAAGVSVWIAGQTTINIGGVVGLLPITGVPLPFISKGGTALVVVLAATGILASFARAEPDAAWALHAHTPARWLGRLWAPLPPPPPEHRTERRR